MCHLKRSVSSQCRSCVLQTESLTVPWLMLETKCYQGDYVETVAGQPPDTHKCTQHHANRKKGPFESRSAVKTALTFTAYNPHYLTKLQVKKKKLLVVGRWGGGLSHRCRNPYGREPLSSESLRGLAISLSFHLLLFPFVSCRDSIIWPLTASILSPSAQQNCWTFARERERETLRKTDSSASRVPICLWWCSFSCQGLFQVYMSDLISFHVHLPFDCGVGSFSHVFLSLHWKSVVCIDLHNHDSKNMEMLHKI